MTVLAIDQGTTSTRAIRVNNQGQSQLVNAIKHQQLFPNPGWVEHDPEELVRSIQTCLDSNQDVDVIGIDNQGESCLAWHADSKQALCPVIVWQDSRTEEIINRLKQNGHEALVLKLSGLPLDSYFSASKLAWIINNIPQAKSLLKTGKLRLGTTDAFFIDRFANRFVTDITTASRTSLMNLETGNWDQTLCNLFSVPISCLPEIVPTCADIAEIQLGEKTIPIRANVVDQQASLYGHGCRKAGDTKITFGTGAFALTLTGNQLLQAPDKGLLPTIAWQHQGQSPIYALEGGVYNAGSAIDWARRIGLFENYDELNHFEKEFAIVRGLAFVPALSGLACPHWDRQAAGLWIGLSLDTDQKDMMQSLLEGIAFRAAEVVNAINDFTPVSEKLSIDGGVSVNPYFCQFLANIMDRKILVKTNSELTALGTAQLAGAKTADGDGDVKCYGPSIDLSGYCERFSEAVSRSRNWRTHN